MAESLITLLSAAYTVEQKSLAAIKKHLITADNPDTEVRIRAHFVETQWQIKLLKACLELLGIDREALDAKECRRPAETGGTGLLAIKRLEIDLYKKVIVEARRQHAPEVLQACREILEQERAMAEWIEDNHFMASPPFPVRGWTSVTA